jgi:hypothetical protein
MDGQRRLEIDDLKGVFLSDEYRAELEDLSCYGAHIKQERPMCYLLAKYLKKRGFEVDLEKKEENYWYDLIVNGAKIEIKFYHESDLMYRLEKEMKRCNWDINRLVSELNSRNVKRKSYSWNMTLMMIKDILFKRPDIFILIILSRDLRKSKVDLEHVCLSEDELKYNKNRGFNNKLSFESLQKFLKCIRIKRNFIWDYARIDVSKIFPSSYHLYLCDFRV